MTYSDVCCTILVQKEGCMEYKGMQLDDDIGSLVRNMPQVDTYRESLSQLQAVWDSLALLGQLSGVGNEMGDTRESFFSLSQSLINQLAHEYYQRVEDGLIMKASVSVDMMLRNLFERTADIGFLATDDALREFMRLAPKWQNRYGALTRVLRDTQSQKMQQRLQAYVTKYSVYNNVILLSPTGEVLLQLVETGVQQSYDPLITASLLTQEAYIEVFRRSDLLPNVAQPHIYAYRITDEKDEPLGVICLCFDFQDECQRIFAELDDADWAVMTLIDANGIVIASHDPIQIPVGIKLSVSSNSNAYIQRFAGRQYLSVTRKGLGYQGYMGLGWQGHVMIPLEYAFEQTRNLMFDMPSIEGLDIFSDLLMTIPLQADHIQERLNRSVWNGSIRQARNASDSGFGRALLGEVSQTGLRTKAVFSSAIENLYRTVIGATLESNRVVASLAINIMDRNLYERANDCRWWALTDVFRHTLAHNDVTPDNQKQISKILSYINQLYTVYTGIVVYDKQGVVQAVSQDALACFVGKKLQASWVEQSLLLNDSQKYVVSSFEKSVLYNNQETYIYAAAIMHPDDATQPVGGIGIIFDSFPQFSAMLTNALPDDHGHESFAVLYDEQQRIISTTHPTLAIGNFLPADMIVAQNEGSAVLSCGYGRYAVGVTRSSGYREYKGQSDAYQQVVYAAIFKRIGGLLTDMSINPEKLIPSFKFEAKGEQAEIATFVIGERYFGLSVSSVVESVDVQLMARVAVGNSLFSGYVKHQGQAVPVLDLSSYLGVSLEKQLQAVIVEENGVRFAILVDKLGAILSIPISVIVPIMRHSQEHIIESLISGENDSALDLMMLSSNKIRSLVLGGHVIAEAMPAFSEMIEVGSIN